MSNQEQQKIKLNAEQTARAEDYLRLNIMPEIQHLADLLVQLQANYDRMSDFEKSFLVGPLRIAVKLLNGTSEETQKRMQEAYQAFENHILAEVE